MRFARRLWITDLIILTGVVFTTQLITFGFGPAVVATRTQFTGAVPYWLFSLVLVVLWMWALALNDTRAPSVIGAGNLEYMRVLGASFQLFGALAIIAFVTEFEVARGYLLLSLPAGVALLELSRWSWRLWLTRQRVTGAYTERVILIGTPESVRRIADELKTRPGLGYTVVGACISTGGRVGAGIADLGSVDDLRHVLIDTAADTVIVASTDGLPTEKVKEISWMLETGRQHLVLAPGILDVAGPRIHTRPVLGLPLTHVETPNFSRGQRWAKRLFDIFAGFALLVVLSPFMLAIGLLVKMSGGPVFFLQKRIGRDGRPFRMIKFRSMTVDAEDRLNEVNERNDTNEILFKRMDDPRVTPLGRWMRRHSIDELPQLLNVLDGSMSLVGPRPPLPSEVEKYADHVHRRFLTKPGMTGAWQVGGRSTLSWEESVRLDLSYVENWSLPGDIVILARTLREVITPGRHAA
ncbi:sugar transferase [Microbacterium mangrovi]|nr:sugar transferase [Microbacterium mangrovi]